MENHAGGANGNLWHDPISPLVGGSGALFGLMGCALALSMRRGRHLLDFMNYVGPRQLVSLLVVNLVIGKIRGFDGKAERTFPSRKLSVIDFDQARIAPALYKACERGHVWEQEDFRFCPYDGLALDSYRIDGVAMR